MKNGVTVTQYLTAVLINSIYKGNVLKNKKTGKTIKVCVPVNLKKYFPSDTLANFFSYITIEANIEKNNLQDFDKLLYFVKDCFEKKLEKEEVIKTMSSNVKIGTNFFIKIIPLWLKNAIVRAAYVEIRKYTTITFSNIGRMGIIGKYKNYIQYFLMLIAPENVEKIKCSACTFENKIIFTFTSILKDNNIEREFYNFLMKKGIEVQIKDNGILNSIDNTKNENIYPKKVSAQKSDFIMYGLMIISVLTAILLVIINNLTTPKVAWAALVNCGILYSWITVLYAIKKDVNIAGYVLLHMFVTSLIAIYMDYKLGFGIHGWSSYIAIPIITIISNATMMILTIVSYKRYIRYAIYQFIIIILSIIPLFFMYWQMMSNIILSYIALAISIINFVLTIVYCEKDIKEAIIRKFHI